MQEANVRSETPVQEPMAPASVEALVQTATAETPPAVQPAPETQSASASASKAGEGTNEPSQEAAEADVAVKPEEVPTEAPSEEPKREDGRLVALQAEVKALKQALDDRPTADDLRDVQSTVEELQERLDKSEAATEPSDAVIEATELRQQVASLRSDLTELGSAVRQAAAPGRVEVGATPPEVLQSAYEASLTELYAEMVKTLGPGALASARVVMESVRRSSSGTEFFSLEDNRFVAKGIADALKQRRLSPYQVQETFNELFRRLAALVPRYQPQPLSELISSGTSAFVVSTLTGVLEQVEAHLAGVESISTAHSTISEQLAQLERRIVDVGESAEAQRQAAEERLAALEARGSVGQGGAQRKQAKRSKEGG